MVFCANCGKVLTEEAAFCGFCGTRITDAVVITSDTVTAANSTVSFFTNRVREYNELKHICDWFSVKENVYLSIVEDSKNYPEKVAALSRSKPRPRALVWGIILTVFGIALFGTAGVAGLFLFIPGLYLLLNFIIKRAYIKKKIPKLQQELKQRTEQNYDVLRQWYADYEKKFGSCRIAFKETDPRLLRAFLSYFDSGRADSIKEAISCFDQERHNRFMEEQAVQATEASRAAAQAASRAAYNSAVAAAYAAADFWLISGANIIVLQG